MRQAAVQQAAIEPQATSGHGPGAEERGDLLLLLRVQHRGRVAGAEEEQRQVLVFYHHAGNSQLLVRSQNSEIRLQSDLNMRIIRLLVLLC